MSELLTKTNQGDKFIIPVAAEFDGTSLRVFNPETGQTIGFAGCSASAWVMQQTGEGVRRIALLLDGVEVLQPAG